MVGFDAHPSNHTSCYAMCAWQDVRFWGLGIRSQSCPAAMASGALPFCLCICIPYKARCQALILPSRGWRKPISCPLQKLSMLWVSPVCSGHPKPYDCWHRDQAALDLNHSRAVPLPILPITDCWHGD